MSSVAPIALELPLTYHILDDYFILPGNAAEQ